MHVCAGKGLCMLKKEDCRHRAPRDGDVIYSIFTMLMNSVPDGQLTYLLTYLLTYYFPSRAIRDKYYLQRPKYLHSSSDVCWTYCMVSSRAATCIDTGRVCDLQSVLLVSVDNYKPSSYKDSLPPLVG